MQDDKEPQGNPWMKSVMIWSGILLAMLLVASMFGGASQGTGSPMAYSEFREKVQEGAVKEVVLSDDRVSGKLNSGESFSANIVRDPELLKLLNDNGVKYDGKPTDQGNIWVYLLIQALPFMLILGIAFFVFRQVQKNNGSGAMGFGKSRAKMLTEKQGRVTFDDVAGIDEAREELQEIVEFLKDPTMFVGVGASRVRDMFEQAKRNAPCIVFIDEIDAVGRHRGAGLGNGNDEREQTLNQLLVEMDGFEANEGIIIVAATNRPDVLDPALLRPGRFDRQVVVPRPDIEGRQKILEVHTRKKPLAPDVDLRRIARGTPGFSGADLANLANEAALLAARKGKRLIASSEFEEAKDKVLMGAERRSMVMTEDEKKATAYHEAGHALVSIHVEHNDPLHKVTIIPRGRALGVTWNLPERDRYSMSMKQMKARLALCFGGRIAEQLIYGKDELNTGASNDIQQATDMARSMVMEYGMSDKLGWLRYRDNQDEVFLGHSVSRAQNMSEETAKLIDAEVRRLVEDGEKTARKVLTDHLDELHLLAGALLEYETLSGEEARRAIKGEDIGRDSDANKPGAPIQGHAGGLPQIKRKPRPFGDTHPQGA